MKLFTKSDDYGFTRGVTVASVDAIKNGFLRNTGIFPSVPEFENAASLIPTLPECCFGIDFNIVGGPCVSDPKKIPHLVDDKGWYIRSSARFQDPKWQTEEGRRELFPEEEVWIELNAQYDKYVNFVGKPPEYLNGHSISSWCEPLVEGIAKLAKEKNLVYIGNIRKKFFNVLAANAGGASKTKQFDPFEQMKKDPEGVFWAAKEEALQHEYVMAGVHCGFVDAEMFLYTSMIIERAMDHKFLTSKRIMQWIEDNNVELGFFRDCMHLQD